MIYLYVKTHNKTGLKYLGKTQLQDPHAYKGSGKLWRTHCSKHGYDYSTEIIFQSESMEEIREKGIYYSDLWNIVESKDWANLTREEGTGGTIPASLTEEANAKRSAALKGRTLSEEHRKKLSEANKGKYWHSEETKKLAAKKASAKLKGKKKPDGFGEKVRAANLGKIMSKEAKEKMRNSWTPERLEEQRQRRKEQNAARPILTCPHCGLQGKNPGNMKRYHFDSCSKCLHDDLN
jgi:hypothetical protein